MKTETDHILKFKKSNIVELNNYQLNFINGGSETPTSDLFNITMSMSISPTVSSGDCNGSSKICDPSTTT